MEAGIRTRHEEEESFYRVHPEHNLARQYNTGDNDATGDDVKRQIGG